MSDTTTVTVPQMSRSDLDELPPEEITAAMGRGELATLLGQEPPVDWPATLAARAEAARQREAALAAARAQIAELEARVEARAQAR